MKKIFTILLLAVFLLIPNINAEELKYYKVDVRNINTNREKLSNEDLAFDLVSEYLYYSNRVVFSNDYSVSSYYNEDRELMYSITSLNDNYQDLQEHRILLDIPEDAPYTYELLLKDIPSIPDNELFDFLNEYDGIQLILRDEVLEFNSDKECDSVCIDKVKILERTRGKINKSAPIFNGLELNLDLALKKVDDVIKFEVNINNPTDKDYEVSTPEGSKDTDFIKYEYTFKNDDNILKANSNKTMYVTVRYNKKVEEASFVDGVFKEEKKAVIKLSNGVEEKPTPVEIPDTYAGISIFIVFGLIALLGYLSYNKLSNKMLLLLIPLLLLPVIVNAYEKLEVKVNTKVEIIERKAIMMARPEGVRPIEETPIIDDSNLLMSSKDPVPLVPFNSKSFWNFSEFIQTITFENKIRELDNYMYKYDISDARDNSVIAYLVDEQDTGYYDLYIMADGDIYANPDSSYLFESMNRLSRINNLKYLNTSLVTDMSYMFSKCYKLTSIDLSNFDTSKVTNMSYMFSFTGNIMEPFNIEFGPKFIINNNTKIDCMIGNTQEFLNNHDIPDLIPQNGICFITDR